MVVWSLCAWGLIELIFRGRGGVKKNGRNIRDVNERKRVRRGWGGVKAPEWLEAAPGARSVAVGRGRTLSVAVGHGGMRGNLRVWSGEGCRQARRCCLRDSRAGGGG